jgi:hypothetical protein
MLKEPEVNHEDVNRMILEVAPLESEQLKFQVQGLGSTSLDKASERVSARVLTNYGQRDFLLARRDGQWRIANVPDLLVPQEAGPMRLAWEMTNSYWSDDGKVLYVAGNMRNTSSAIGYMLSIGAYVHDEAGTTVATGRFPVPGSPYLEPNEERPFQIAFRAPSQESGVKLDPGQIVIVPDFRQATTTGQSSFDKKLTVEPARLPWLPGAMTFTLRNSEAEGLNMAVWGYVRDASDRLLAVVGVNSGKIAAGEVQTLPVNVKLPQSLSTVANIDLVVVQSTAQSKTD